MASGLDISLKCPLKSPAHVEMAQRKGSRFDVNGLFWTQRVSASLIVLPVAGPVGFRGRPSRHRPRHLNCGSPFEYHML